MLIGGNCCANCAHSNIKNNEMSCRRHPPTPFPVMGVNGEGEPTLLGKLSMFPIVQPDSRCGEWKQGLVNVAND